MEQTVVQVKRSEIKRCVNQIKGGKYKQVYLVIDGEGNIEGRWFSGRSDFVLRPGFILLLELEPQTEESIIYALTMIIRNREGYAVVAG